MLEIETPGIAEMNSTERKREVRRIFSHNVSVQLNRYNDNAGKGGRLTQKAIAEAIGVTPFDMSRYFRGDQTPTPGRVKAIAEVLKCDPDDLVPGYVIGAESKAMTCTMNQLRNGNVWIEFAGSFKPEDAASIMQIMTRMTGDLKSD